MIKRSPQPAGTQAEVCSILVPGFERGDFCPQDALYLVSYDLVPIRAVLDNSPHHDFRPKVRKQILYIAPGHRLTCRDFKSEVSGSRGVVSTRRYSATSQIEMPVRDRRSLS